MMMMLDDHAYSLKDSLPVKVNSSTGNLDPDLPEPKQSDMRFLMKDMSVAVAFSPFRTDCLPFISCRPARDAFVRCQFSSSLTFGNLFDLSVLSAKLSALFSPSSPFSISSFSAASPLSNSLVLSPPSYKSTGLSFLDRLHLSLHTLFMWLLLQSLTSQRYFIICNSASFSRICFSSWDSFHQREINLPFSSCDTSRNSRPVSSNTKVW